VVDEGSGFDPETPTEKEGELDEGGLGIAIIRALVDELEIDSNGAGCALRFTKYLN
jgi:anti-sigma regulatory factor (Ser/Thr protein kinase)